MPLFEATIQLIQICGECQQLNNHCDTGNVNIGMQGLVTIQDYDTMSGHLRLGSSTCCAFGHQGIQCLAEYL